jgi:intracellular sulfur oxidation DsrE/DsrF family protein
LSLLLEPDAVENTRLKHGNATDEVQARISGLKDQGVAFQVCGITLKGKQIAFEDDIVPSGVAEISRLQGMGYTYIKP